MKSIYFDIGGVLFKDGMTKFIETISNEYPIPNEDSFGIYKLTFHKSPNARKLRTGELSLDKFYEIELGKLRKEFAYDLSYHISKEELSKLWFSQYKPILGMKELILKLKDKGHTIGIISANFKERFDYVFGENNMLHLFDEEHIFLTYNLRLDKKDPKFYEQIGNTLGSSKEDAFYIEDIEDYILNAKNAGLSNSLLYDYHQGESIKEILEQLPQLKSLLS